jgi:outer membrane protein assembly factor BamA
VQLGADLDLIGTAAAPAMSGRATFRDGGQLFVGRNTYTVTSDQPSTIDFVSANAIAPELNVHVTTHVAGEDIDLDLTGPAESPQVAMSSTNGDSEADITALLLTGRKLDELATADASFIGTQVIGNLSGEVLGFAGRAIGLDTLRLGGVEDTGIRQDPNAIASEVDPTSRLTFSKALGSKIDLTFSQSLRDATAQTWIVDYLPARQLDVRVVNGDTNLRTYRLRHDISFGGARATLPRVASAARPREPRVTDVVISGTLIAPEQRLRSLLKLRAGDTFDFGRWQDDRDRLEDFYHHSDRLTARVAASRMANGDEVKLAYMIDAGPQTSILVSGIDLSREEVARLADAWSTSIFDGFLVDEATQIVKGDLATRGYLQPTVMARVETTADMKRLRVDIQPGARTTEARISVQIDDPSLAADLDAHIGERHLATQVVADPNAVTSDITAYLRARGYLRAVVTAGAPRFDQGTTTVPVTVQAGPLFTIASVAFEGRQGVPANDLASVAAIAAGMPYDPGAIDGARRRLLTLYRGRGFATADVESRADVVAESQRVSVTFVVRESAQQTIGDIIVSGNGGVNSDVVTRALGLMVGAPLEPAELVRARARVFSTGLFRRVDVTTEMMARTGPADAPQPMRVRVDVEAWPALRLQYGFQVAEVHPESDPTGLSLQPGLSAEATRRTLFGRDLTLGGVVEVERWQNTVRGLVSAPTLFAIPLQSQLVVERVREQSQATPFSTARSSVAWQQLLKRASHLSLSYSYRFDEDHTFDNIPDPGTGLNFDIRIRIARLIGAAAWDTRNDPLNAVRGSLMSSTIEWAPDRLGSQFRFLKYIGQAYRFQNVHGVVLASAARLGLAQPLGGQELILSERFFAGGSRTVRGVGEGALGRRDIFGDPAGGESMLVLNQEARFPIHKWLGGVAFIDAGNVYPRPTAIRLNEMTGSIGFGFRLSTPFALLRADYGRIIWQGATEPPPGSTLRPGQWTFGIGQAF